MAEARLEKQRALGMLPADRVHPSARLIQERGVRIRVGDVFSPVMPGDPSPTGGIYRAGQYSPHVDDLAVATFASARNAGILPAGLPIFDDAGNLDVRKLEEWKPASENLPVAFSDDIPAYSSAIVVSSMKYIDSGLLGNLNISVAQAPRTFGDFGNYIVGARTSGENRQFVSQLFVYPDFYKFIDKPIVPQTPKRESGLSVSAFMTFHAMGHILLSKLTFEGKIGDISAFMDSSGWTKTPDSTHEKAWFMGRKSTSAWYRSTSHHFLSELSRYSPIDDFAQAFAFYHTSNEYFQKIDPEKYSIMHKIISEQS
jgi:hypothetical protein